MNVKNLVTIAMLTLMAMATSASATLTVQERTHDFQLTTEDMDITVWKWIGLRIRQKNTPKHQGFQPEIYPFPKTRRKPEAARILRNDQNMVFIQLKSKPFEHRFGALVRQDIDLCLRKDSPCLFIRMRLINQGLENSNLNQAFGFSAVNCPDMPSDGSTAKVDGQGYEKKVKGAKNFFFYTDPDGHTWGIITADLDKPQRRLFANTPKRNKGRWLIAYFQPSNEKIFANEEFSTLNIVIFPARTPKDVRSMYQNLCQNHLMDGMWKYLD